VIVRIYTRIRGHISTSSELADRRRCCYNLRLCRLHSARRNSG